VVISSPKALVVPGLGLGFGIAVGTAVGLA
jgi:hypothetical protein